MPYESLQALAQGLLDGGCQYTTNYPGFKSHELFSLLSDTSVAINEKIAYEMAFGASLAGVRAVATFKSFGLNDAADPFLNSLVIGVQGGLVLVVIDDTEVEGSQARMDTRYYRDFFGGLWFEPSTVENAYDIAYSSFSWSEELDIPIVIRLTNQFFSLTGQYARRPQQNGVRRPANSPEKFVVHPIHWKAQYRQLQEKNKVIDNFVEEYFIKTVGNSLPEKNSDGVIVLGCCNNELRQINDDHDILQINTYPFPMEIIRTFIKSKRKITIIEQGSGYAADLIKKSCYADFYAVKIVSNTGIIPAHDKNYWNWSGLEKLFLGLKSIQPSFVVSDVTQFTVETTHTIKACLCLGACVPIGIGLAESGIQYPFCLSGDSSLLHVGLDILREVKARSVKLGIVVIDNGGSRCTGGQMAAAGFDVGYINLPVVTVKYTETEVNKFSSIFRQMKDTQEAMLLRVLV